MLNETPVAIKFEPRKADAPQLRDEYRTYKLLAGSGESGMNGGIAFHDPYSCVRSDTFSSTCVRYDTFSRPYDAILLRPFSTLILPHPSPFIVGVPNVYYFGQEGLHNILVIDLLGHSLEDMFDMCGRKLSVKTVAMVAKQMVFIALEENVNVLSLIV